MILVEYFYGGVFVCGVNYRRGFSSGQEIISFFVRYGKISIFGILLSALIFGFFAYCVLDECRRYNISDYGEYTLKIMPKKFGVFVKYLTLAFSGICFCAMAAGSGAMFAQLLGVNEIYGNVLMCLLSLAFVIPKNQSALKYNALFGGIITVGIISCCVYILCFREHQAFFNITKTAVSSVSYAGYNLITAGLVLVKLSRGIRTKAEAIAAGVFSFMVMFFIMLLMWAILSIYYGKVNLGEIPMLTMAKRQNMPITVIYAALLFMSVLTTAIASAVGVSEIAGKKYAVPFLLVSGISFGSAGFSNIINIAYRICGYFGIIMTLYIIIKKIKSGEKTSIKEKIRANNK